MLPRIWWSHQNQRQDWCWWVTCWWLFEWNNLAPKSEIAQRHLKVVTDIHRHQHRCWQINCLWKGFSKLRRLFKPKKKWFSFESNFYSRNRGLMGKYLPGNSYALVWSKISLKVIQDRITILFVSLGHQWTTRGYFRRILNSRGTFFRSPYRTLTCSWCLSFGAFLCFMSSYEFLWF